MRILRARLLAGRPGRGRRRGLRRPAQSQVRTVDRSERIRTYNFPENRISDHRTGYKAYNLDQVLDGDLQPVLDSCVEADLAARLDALRAQMSSRPRRAWSRDGRRAAGRRPGVASPELRRRRAAGPRPRHHPRRGCALVDDVARRGRPRSTTRWWPAAPPASRCSTSPAPPASATSSSRRARASSCRGPRPSCSPAGRSSRRGRGRRGPVRGRRPVHRLGRDRASRWPTRCRQPEVHAVELDEPAHRWADAQPRRHRRRPAARRHGRRPSTTSPAPSTWCVCNPPYIPLEAWESVAPRRATTTRSWRCSRATTASTRCGCVERRAARLLRPGGVVGAEHADVQGESAPAVFAAPGRWADVRDHADLAGRPRFMTARLAR